MDTKELDRAINISQQIRIELIKNGMEATEELAHTMEILMCKTHDMISSFNSENTEGVSTTAGDESGVLHDVSDRNASRCEPLALRTDYGSELYECQRMLNGFLECKIYCGKCELGGKLTE